MKTAACALLTLVPLVAGHGYMSNPQPRARTIPGHLFRYEPQSDGVLNGQCQDGGQTGPIQATWTEGQTITVTGTVTAEHNGWIELRICPNANGDNACFESNRLVTTTPSSTPGGPAPVGSTDSVLQDAQYRSDTRHGQTSWVLPSGLTCEHCSMQWWWITQNYGFEHFKSCHDVRIVSKEDAAALNLTTTDDLVHALPMLPVEDEKDEIHQPYCSFQQGARFTGPVIETENFSPSKCCDACASTDGCLAWESRVLMQGDWECSLLSSITGFDKNSGSTSGFASA